MLVKADKLGKENVHRMVIEATSSRYILEP